MDKNRLVIALYELSILIKPENPENLLMKFLATTCKKFEFSYAYAEIPRLNLILEIPRKGKYSDLILFEKKVCKVGFGRNRKIPEEYVSALDPIVEKIDFMIDYITLAEARYKKMIEQSKDLILLVDESENVIEANTSAIKVLGNIIGKKIDRIWLNNYVEYKGRSYSVRCYEVLDIGKQIVARDITDIKRMEKNLIELNETLKLINKIMRHDILNDLTVISLALEMYNETKDEKLIEKAQKTIERSVNLINKMRELESLVSFGVELKPYNVREVVEEVIEKYPEIEFNIKGNCTVLADGALTSVIDNIVGNAIIHGNTDKIDVTIGKTNNFCEIRITDYGKGIPDEIKDKIFEEGFKYGETGHTGLGLYIIKKVVERYGGSIEVEDNKPRGAVFVIRLKRA